MPDTSGDQSIKSYEAAIIRMSIPYAAVCQPSEPQPTEFNAWWHAMTLRIKQQKTLPSAEEQYKQDLSREDKIEQLPGFRDILNELKELETLEEDWNGEDAPAVDRASIQQAQAFVKSLACSMSNQLAAWLLPSVYPTTEGGVQLYWSTKGGQTALTFRPGQQNVDYITKELDQPASRGSCTAQEAVAMALLAMRDV